MDWWMIVTIALVGVPAGVLMAMIASDLSAPGSGAEARGLRRRAVRRLRKADA